MYDMDGNKVLCGANSYTQKYYFNEEFSRLPENVQDELQALCVLHVEDVGGILLLEYDEGGNLMFRVESEEGDAFFDEIGSGLKLKQLRQDKRPLFEALELFYRTFCLEAEA